MLQLAANAVRHAQGPFAIGSRVRGTDLELFVRDRGPGVPDALKTTIFERFRRGTAEGRGDGGSGLGLAIVALIAETHGGKAWVADAGAGSEFILTLPGAIVPTSERATASADGAGVDPPHPRVPPEVEPGGPSPDQQSDQQEQQWHRS
jgi:signal transduction histidine kinase